MLKAPQQQARANQRHERHSNLRDHQEVVCAAMSRSARPFAPLLESSCEICPECAQRRKQPANDPVATQTAAVNASTALFRPLSRNTPRSAGTNAIKVRKPQAARIIPSAPPANDSNMLSVSSWRDNRQELAPNAVRTATSRSLPALRTSSRFTMFAQAISSTRPTAPESTNRMPCSFAADGSSIGSTSTPKNLCESGY